MQLFQTKHTFTSLRACNNVFLHMIHLRTRWEDARWMDERTDNLYEGLDPSATWEFLQSLLIQPEAWLPRTGRVAS